MGASAGSPRQRPRPAQYTQNHWPWLQLGPEAAVFVDPITRLGIGKPHAGASKVTHSGELEGGFGSRSGIAVSFFTTRGKDDAKIRQAL
jgi:hypothetical protein